MMPLPPRNDKRFQTYSDLERRYAGVRPRTLLIGNSRAKHWPDELIEEFGRPAVNLGVSGDQMPNVLWRLRHTAIDLSEVRLAIIMDLINDIRRSALSPEAMADSVRVLADEIAARAPRARILTILPAPSAAEHRYTSERWRNTCTALSDLAKRSGAFEAVDPRFGEEPKRGVFQARGLHFKPAAYPLLQAAVREALAAGAGPGS